MDRIFSELDLGIEPYSWEFHEYEGQMADFTESVVKTFEIYHLPPRNIAVFHMSDKTNQEIRIHLQQKNVVV